MKIHRRQFVAGASGIALTAGLAACGQQTTKAAEVAPTVQPAATVQNVLDADITEVKDELVETFLAESFNEGQPAAQAADVVTSWEELQTDPGLMSRAKTVVKDVGSNTLKAKSIADAESPDYIRFVASDFGKDGELAAAEFTITDAVLRSIAEANGYTAALKLETQPTVIVGLRGCALTDRDTASATGASITVKEAAVDHVRRRCLVCVWDTKTGNIQAFSGSTVPNLVNMQYYVFWRFFQTGQSPEKWTHGQTMACLLPQGLHQYTVGVHLRREPKTRQQPGALIQTTPTPVLRAKRDVGYSILDEWDPLDWEPGGSERGVRLVGVNIHAGVNRALPPYASKGCQTIFGWYTAGTTPEMLWKDFQSSLGITVSQDAAGAVKFTKEGAVFPYMLTTGRDARLHAAAAGDPVGIGALKRVLLGSKGKGASALREFLKLPAGDTVDGKVMAGLLKWQKGNDLPRDGVVTPKLSTDWKINAI